MDIETFNRYVMTTYGRQPIVAARGEGCRLWDVEGREYLDFVAGIAVCALGHSSPVIREALVRQLDTLQHVSNLYYHELQGELARWLVEHSFADKVFFCNSGAEANEAAFKLARKYARTVRGIESPVIVTALESFHGRTIAGITATGQSKYREGFGPLVPGFDYVRFNDFSALEALIDRIDAAGPRVAAVLLEPVQGEGGVTPLDAAYIAKVRALCTVRGILLAFDEVQTGIGRTGKFWGYERFGVEPDLLTAAKGIAGGFPMGALLAKDFCSVFKPGDHASTFGGSPLACAAALAVCREVYSLVETGVIASRGEELRGAITGVVERFPRLFSEARGLGLMCGVQIDAAAALEAPSLVRAAMEAGLLVAAAGPKVVRFIPPLVVSSEEIAAGVERFARVCESVE